MQLIGRIKSRFFVAQCFAEALQRQSLPTEGVEGSATYVREVFYKRKLPAGLKRGVHVP